MTDLYTPAATCPECRHRIYHEDGTCHRPQCSRWRPPDQLTRDLIDRIRARRAALAAERTPTPCQQTPASSR